MLREAEFEYLRANPRFLARELQNRGIDVDVLDWEESVLQACYGTHSEIFLDINGSIMPYSAAVIAGDKELVKQLLRRNGVSVPQGSRFSLLEKEAIITAARQLGFPVVLKPVFGVQGEQVHTGLENERDVDMALETVLRELGPVDVLLEEQCIGKEYRIFITKDAKYAVLHRDPAHVIGDGKSTIRLLAAEESNRRMTPRRNCLCEIVLDDEAERYLRRGGKTFETIPEQGEKVYVRGSSNVKMGGVCEDLTEQVHPSVIEISLRALQSIPQLPYGGIDFICQDVTAPQNSESYHILEINSVPGIGMHLNPAKGKPRNVAAMIVDLIFPESVNKS